MNSEILYRKVGKRYQPAGLQFEADAFPRGAHLVVVDRGWQHVRYNVVPDHAALLAAAEPMRDAIRETVSRLLAMRPTRRPVTATQRAAWDAFSRAMGNDQYIVEYPAVGEIADAVMDLLLRHSAKSEPTARLFAQVGSTDGLGTAVPPAPTFEGENSGT